MYKHNNKTYFQFKIAILSTIIMVCFGLLAASWQQRVMEVSAQLNPDITGAEHINFDVVFPGEVIAKNFILELIEGDIVEYQLMQQEKPLPPEHPDYDPNSIKYYKNLCPYLEMASMETAEGDTPESAMVNSEDDSTDSWQAIFEVPAVIGNIAQDHTGGFISSSGEYGCDIVVDIDESMVTQTGGGGTFTSAISNSTLFPTSRFGGLVESPFVLGEEGVPNLTVAKNILNTKYINPGDKGIEFEIIITNNGTLTAFEVEVVDNLPDGFLFDGTDRMSQLWTPGDIAPGEFRRIHYLVEATDKITSGEYENVVMASALNHNAVTARADIEVRDVSVLGIMQETLEDTGFSMYELLLILIIVISLTLLAQTLKKREQI